jgi:pyridoxine 5-phosphate synthase
MSRVITYMVLDGHDPVRLGVNIDHVATIRQARGGLAPSITEAANLAVRGGADLITVHLREDRRHIQDSDVYSLKRELNVPLNLELAATAEMVSIACDIKPTSCCLVPERRAEITTEGGLDVHTLSNGLEHIVETLDAVGTTVSAFIDPNPKQVQAAADIGIKVIEFHTGKYSLATDAPMRIQELNELKEAMSMASSLGIQVHAGHGLDYQNVGLIAQIKDVRELNIGHAIVARALYMGLEKAVELMKRLILEVDH